VLDARFAELPGPKSLGLGIHRASLFGLPFDAAVKSGVTIEPAHEVAASSCDATGRWLEFSNAERAGPFDLVIDALGLHTPLAPRCGKDLTFGALWATLPWPDTGPFQRNRLEQRYRAAREMVGVLPTGTRAGNGEELAFFWSLPADGYERWQDRGLSAWRSEVAALWPECAPLAEQIVDPAQLSMARYAHRTLPAPAQHRLIHLGDAWHTASPQLGQGANMGLLDAWAVAEALRLSRDPLLVPALTVQLRGIHIALYQAATAFFTPLYQSNAATPAWVRDRLFAPASRWWPGKQIQAILMSGLLGAPLARLGLDRVDYAALTGNQSRPRPAGDVSRKTRIP
jgi:2-polyprenyl-6-methoxyphenol hydroxylase-like FAD-dependent oxidoreductase